MTLGPRVRTKGNAACSVAVRVDKGRLVDGRSRLEGGAKEGVCSRLLKMDVRTGNKRMRSVNRVPSIVLCSAPPPAAFYACPVSLFVFRLVEGLDERWMQLICDRVTGLDKPCALVLAFRS